MRRAVHSSGTCRYKRAIVSTWGESQGRGMDLDRGALKGATAPQGTVVQTDGAEMATQRRYTVSERLLRLAEFPTAAHSKGIHLVSWQ